MEQKSIMQELREIPIGKHKDFPIKRMRTVQNYRTMLNQEGYFGRENMGSGHHQGRRRNKSQKNIVDL